jgi:hypothetical protein
MNVDQKSADIVEVAGKESVSEDNVPSIMTMGDAEEQALNFFCDTLTFSEERCTHNSEPKDFRQIFGSRGKGELPPTLE